MTKKKLNIGNQLRRLWRSPLLWILILTIIAYQFIVVPHWKGSHDSGIYISLAHALANGEGYTYMGYPHTKYPPGLPLMLTPIELFFGHNFLLMRWLIVLCAVGSVGISYLLVRRIASTGVACVVSIATASSYALFSTSTYILSDVPYMFVSLSALYAILHYRQHLTKKNAFLAIVLILAACSIRTVGFTLVPAIAMTFLFDVSSQPLFKRLQHSIVVVAIIALVIGLWMGRNALIPEPPIEVGVRGNAQEFFLVNPRDPYTRTANLVDIAQRIRKNLSYYGYVVVDLLTAKQASNTFLAYSLSGLCLLGFGITLIRQRTVIEYYIFFYGWLILLWPFLQGERPIVPILPMIFYYTLQPLLLLFKWISNFQFQTIHPKRYASLQLLEKIAPISQAAALGLITLVIILFNSRIVIPFIHGERQEPYYRDEARQVAEWVSDNTPEDAVIITRGCARIYMSTGRKSFLYPGELDNPQEVFNSIMRNNGTYLIATIDKEKSFDSRYLKPVLRAYSEHFREIHRIGDLIIYEIR